jgi:hypothetical protein
MISHMGTNIIKGAAMGVDIVLKLYPSIFKNHQGNHTIS